MTFHNYYDEQIKSYSINRYTFYHFNYTLTRDANLYFITINHQAEM